MNDKRNYKVYTHINKSNGKVYIGITGMTLSKRWGKNGKGYNKQSIIGRAIQKYGWGNFHHILLEDNLTKSEACGVEIELIAYYKSQGISYNNANGGEINEGYKFHLSEEQKRKIKESNIGKNCYMYGLTHSEQYKKYMHDINIGSNNPFYNCKHSQESREKMSKTKKLNSYKYDHKQGIPRSDEVKKKISETLKKTNKKYKTGLLVQINNESEIYTVKEAANKMHIGASSIYKGLKNSDIYEHITINNLKYIIKKIK